MIYTLIFLFLLVVYGIRFDREKAYGSYLSRERTDSIKGIFILMVFFSHIKDYIVKAGYEYSGQGDEVFQYFFSFIGQLMVVMFLFYSGYGVMESIRKKGEAYVVAMPRHRVAGTLINFDVAVLIFLVVDLLLGRDVVLSKIVLSFLAWDSLGNSNWYIFAILICYLLTCLVAKWCHTPNAVGGVMFALLTGVVILLYFVKEPWWYNTLWAYPAGMVYSSRRKSFEKLVVGRYWLVLVLLVIAFIVVYMIPFGVMGFKTNVLSILFALIVITITMRVSIGNRVLEWSGKKLFPLYIYQRIPMIIFSILLPTWVLVQYPMVYIAICMFATVAIASMYKYIQVKL